MRAEVACRAGIWVRLFLNANRVQKLPNWQVFWMPAGSLNRDNSTGD